MRKKLWLSLSLLLPLVAGAHQMVAPKTVIGPQDTLAPVIGLAPEEEGGDVYVAAQIVGDPTLYFLNETENFQLLPAPFRRNAPPGSNLPLFSLAGAQLPPGKYILYSVVTEPNADVFDTRSWRGGWAGLRRLLFTAHQGQAISLDFDGDGFPDDDRNHDGFHDDDTDFDGFHDDDLNRDGFHDDDGNFDGCHDSGVAHPGECQPTPPQPEGTSLYLSYCASCHGNPPDARALKGTNAQVIANAIARNKGGMGGLNGLLDSAQLEAIAAFLRNFR
jgi:hypothetical protein